MDSNGILMESVIYKKLEEVERMSAEDNNYKAAVDAVVAMEKARAEALKLEEELELEKQKLELEKEKLELEKNKAAEEQKGAKTDRIINGVAKAAEIAVPALLYSVLFTRGLKFEQTGSVTSGFFRGLITKIRPTK